MGDIQGPVRPSDFLLTRILDISLFFKKNNNYRDNTRLLLLLQAMACQKKSNNFTHLLNASKRRGGTGSRKPWRTRTIRAGVKLTAGQKAERKKKFATDKKSYKEAIAEAHQWIRQTAAEIHERFPRRSADEIATDIFQSHRLHTSTKDVGRYHAFVSLQSKVLNAGECRLYVRKIILITLQRFLRVHLR